MTRDPSTAFPMPLDHLVLPVRDLAIARERYRALGFTVAPDAAHPFGTGNACVFFADGTYLEPLASVAPQQVAATAAAGNVFTARHQHYLEAVGEGFSGIALAAGDAVAVDDVYRAAGISAGERLEFGRQFVLPDGRSAEARFLLAFAAEPHSPDFVIFGCERRVPPPADRGALVRHANGVEGLLVVELAAHEPRRHRGFLEQAFGLTCREEADGLSVTLGNCRIALGLDATGSPGLRATGIRLRVADLQVTGSVLAANGIAFEARNDRLLVPPGPGQGYSISFEERA